MTDPELEYRKYEPDDFRPIIIGCPECGWESPDDYQRYIVANKEETIDRRIFISERGINIIKNYWKPLKDEPLSAECEDEEVTSQVKEQIYPRIENGRTYNLFEGKVHRWDEIHCCPVHGEFTVESGYP